MQELNQLKFWCQKVLPLVYDDSLSYYELLCKVVDYLNQLIENYNPLNSILAQYGADIKTLQTQVNELNNELEKVKNGDYVSLYLDSLIAWIDNNIQQLIGRIVKYVTFGLTDDGYFCAYIPQTWDFLQFDTIMTPNDENYGHLVISF